MGRRAQWGQLDRLHVAEGERETTAPGSFSKLLSRAAGCARNTLFTLRLCVQVLHLVGLALLEEQQQLENSSGEDDVTFNYTCKITRQWAKVTLTTDSSTPAVIPTPECDSGPAQVPVQLQVHQAAFWLCWRVCRTLHTWRSTKT